MKLNGRFILQNNATIYLILSGTLSQIDSHMHKGGEVHSENLAAAAS